MTKNPAINGLAALTYIVLVSLVMNYLTRLAPHPNTFLAPIAFLSLFTFSAAVMAYVFAYQPLMFFIEGEKKKAIQLFLMTVAVFGIITSVPLLILLSGIIK